MTKPDYKETMKLDMQTDTVSPWNPAGPQNIILRPYDYHSEPGSIFEIQDGFIYYAETYQYDPEGYGISRMPIGGGTREPEQQDVGIGALGKNVASQFGDALAEFLCLGIGVTGILLPQLVFKVGDELGAEVAHLGAELCALFAVVLELGY